MANNNSTILIVEDDTSINNYILESLSINNYNCKQAFSGTEALLYLKKYDFDKMPRTPHSHQAKRYIKFH